MRFGGFGDVCFDTEQHLVEQTIVGLELASLGLEAGLSPNGSQSLSRPESALGGETLAVLNNLRRKRGQVRVVVE